MTGREDEEDETEVLEGELLVACSEVCPEELGGEDEVEIGEVAVVVTTFGADVNA